MSNQIKEYEVIVIGSGSGASLVEAFLYQGTTVAQVDKGPLGGTCLNVGCIPSKMLIFPADRVVEIEGARKLGIDVDIKSIDFEQIMTRMRNSIGETQRMIREGIRQTENLDFYEGQGRFVSEDTLQVGQETIRGEKIFIASGARPLIPSLEGIQEVEYLTNESVLQLRQKPESMVIIGGGYIGVEYGHFFAAMGTEVTIVARTPRLVHKEEPEVSELLRAKMAQRMNVHTHTEAVEIRKNGKGYVVVGQDGDTGERKEFMGQKIMIAAGRQSNADLLEVEKVGIETDGRGYIKVDEYLQTNKENIWALGDANGKHMFTHVANEEAAVAWHNSNHEHKVKMDYQAVPHAVFAHPQIASVGLTEQGAKKEHNILVGVARYTDVAKGEAMMETDGFAKAILDKESGKLLGFHIIGPYAAMLIQEVIDVMANQGGVEWISKGMHIHPAMSELILSTLNNLREPV
jgi:mycothione reductase